MQELAKEYKASLNILNERINELVGILLKLETASKNAIEDPEVDALKERIKPLRNMQNELRNVAREVENYYETWWYRSPTYTFNRNRPREHVLPGFVYVEARDKRQRAGGNEKANSSIDGDINKKTKTSNCNVLHRRQENA